MTDAELVARANRGDEDAFRQLYERHVASVFSFAWLLTRSAEDAEEIAQECFLVLIQKGRDYDAGKAQLRTWLLGVTRKLGLQKIHRRRRTEVLISEPRERSESPEESLMRDEAAGAVRRAVASLPGSQREAVFLFEFEGLSLKETASILNINSNSVKARLHRARQQLKTALAGLRPEARA
jgi:RNA polymerase sigma-70 factor (ECF subfamily)